MSVTIASRVSAHDQVRTAFYRYEAALLAGDVDTMNELFLDSPQTLRFGVADQQAGYSELARWRAREPPIPPGRRLFQTSIVLLGEQAAVVTTNFDYPGRPVIGRQSQTWLRIEHGWRIAHAHVSEIPASPPDVRESARRPGL